MRRRDFITMLGGVAATWPLAARAQQPGKLPTIGVLGADAAVWRPWMDAFVKRLGERGWVEGRTIAIEYRWDEGLPERIAENVAEFVRQNVDVIVTRGSAGATAKQATTAIPIVFAVAVDPVGGGLVGSLARDRVATSLDYLSNSLILSASGSDSCARLSPSSAD